MAISLQFFADAGLNTPFPGPLSVSQAVDGSTGPVDTQLFLGSAVAGRIFQATSNPGVDSILLSVVDSAPAAGQPVTAARLAFTQAGLASAVPGDPLNLGVQILSEAVNALEVWVRLEDQTAVIGDYTDLSFDTNDLIENAI